MIKFVQKCNILLGRNSWHNLDKHHVALDFFTFYVLKNFIHKQYNYKTDEVHQVYIET